MRAAQPDDRGRVLTELREAIRQLEHRPGRRSGSVPCGLVEVDAVLPGGGFPRGALSELTGGRASGKTAVALSVLAALGGDNLFAWVDGRGEIYPPAAAARGVDLGRLLIVRPGHPLSFDSACPAPRPPAGGEGLGASGSRDGLCVSACLWAAEALLGSGAFAAVVVDVPLRRVERGWDTTARRLQAAAERGGAVGLWLASRRAPVRVPAVLRIDVTTEGGRVVARRTMGGQALAQEAVGRAG